MVTDVELANYFRIIHLMFGGTGSILNLCLLYLAIFQTPKAIRLYSTLIINFAVTDALTCLLDIFIEIRVLPYPNEDSMAHIMNGVCKNFGLTTCVIGFSLYLHTLSHSIWSLLISFGYRYLILFNTSFVKCSSVTLVILAFYLPSFLQAITYWTNFVERSEILPVIERVHPDYDFSENVGLLTGITDLSSVSVVYGMIHTTLPITPVYISVFVIRWKTVKILTKKRDFMSQDTKIMHSQLLKVLTLQAILPATTFGTSYLFIGLRLGIFSGQIYEHLVFSIAILMPVVSPMTYFVFVKPYRQFFIKKFCKKYYQPPIQDIARTRMYSNQEQTLTANRS
ncbi:hypothetical protein GCK72_020549 [Caenorhabditis remanei]|uniref:G-protein coupled receptors family 1 profile domain-containing protein n=1 Tax=Caenorhabditis remanei TaxID=31234 RepID=A0A6A5GHA0_CAERE|nr:hypothetical protein GCK72_020549 [Caenorhabditis remanei]KAF1753991.1 hypothetical protein GCK72_020549 [Caenorhabditis remanei]